MRRIPVIIWISILVLTLMSCNGAQERPCIAVSIPPQQYLLQQIVGDTFEVNSLLNAGSNPETFDPTINSLVSLQKSEVYFRMGNMGFEDVAVEKIRENFPGVKIADSSKGIEIIHGTHSSHGHDEADPHIWVSIKNSKIIAQNLYEEMMTLHPEHGNLFTRNHEALQNRLTELEDSLASVLAPAKGKAFLIWHPSLSYFARDYGLQQMAVEADGKEASPKQISESMAMTINMAPAVFFAEKGHSTAKSASLARQLGLPLVEISLMDGDYLEELKKVASALE